WFLRMSGNARDMPARAASRKSRPDADLIPAWAPRAIVRHPHLEQDMRSSAVLIATLATATLAIGACGAGDTTGPTTLDVGASLEHHRASPLVVMTRN